MIQKYADEEREKILKAAQETLWSNDGAKALEYLRNKRKIADSILAKFQVGYCPRNVHHELAGRIIMPIHDSYGKLIALTTRDFERDEYSHLHESFDKSNYIYGLHVSKENIIRNDKVILVEGQFDAMCFHSYGLTMTVGMLGTSFHMPQYITLSRYCSEVYFIFDGDEAGRQNSIKVMEFYDQYRIKNYGVKFISIVLPDGEDPDDFIVEKGVKEVFGLMKNARQDLYGV